ncbi:MAG: DNA pilot protein [Microviridae sp.]|nr:MAG: DNA pilot protein [Microviridae sp.]
MPFGNIRQNWKEATALWGSALQRGWDKFSPAGVQAANVDKTIKANRELAEYQYSKDLEMWNKGNIYNSPTAQMERLREAGLNPNLVYGNGATGNMAGSLPQYHSPKQEYNYVPPVNIPSMIGMYQDVQLKNAQIDNLKATRETIEKTNFLKGIAGKEAEYSWNYGASPRLNILNEKMRQEMMKSGQMEKLMPYQLSAAQIGNRKLEAEIDKTMAGTDYTREQTNWIASKAVMNLLGSGTSMLKGLFGAGAKGAKGVMNQRYAPTKQGPPHVSRKIRYIK